MARAIQAVFSKRISILGLSIILCSLCISSCGPKTPQSTAQHEQQIGAQSSEHEQVVATSAAAVQAQVSQAEVLQAQSQQARKVEVTFSAIVKKVLPDDTKGLPHELFLLELNNGSTVKVAHDTKYAPRVPIQRGDTVTVKGEYIWNQRGGVVHWTHHSDTPRHEGGYIDFAGSRYE